MLKHELNERYQSMSRLLIALHKISGRLARKKNLAIAAVCLTIFCAVILVLKGTGVIGPQQEQTRLQSKPESVSTHAPTSTEPDKTVGKVITTTAAEASKAKIAAMSSRKSALNAGAETHARDIFASGDKLLKEGEAHDTLEAFENAAIKYDEAKVAFARAEEAAKRIQAEIDILQKAKDAMEQAKAQADSIDAKTWAKVRYEQAAKAEQKASEESVRLEAAKLFKDATGLYNLAVSQATQDKFDRLLAEAKSKANESKGREALKVLEDALALYPDNAEALSLKKKIQDYFMPNAGDVVTNSISMKLVYIPAGDFMMGSPSESKRGNDEGPQHRVKLSKGFWMGQTEVTQAQYQAIMGSNPSNFMGSSLPVEQVSWNDAVEFCQKLSQKEGKNYRLPTEAQWEYACRAGTTTPFYFGETISTDQANYDGNYVYGSGREGINRGKTIEVGSFQPNAFGLYDMHGNVWEWCQDWYGENHYSNSPEVDPQGPSSGQARVLRGGCWNDFPWYCRSAFRYWGTPGYRYINIGFRVVVVP